MMITVIDNAEPIPHRPRPSVRSRRIITTVVCPAPPSTAGTTKKPSEETNVIIIPARTPGMLNGTNTNVKALSGPAPRVRAAGTSRSGTRAMAPRSVSTIRGSITCVMPISTPLWLYSICKGSVRSKAVIRAWFTSPLSPSSTIQENARGIVPTA
jgi:hypothetical protein